jgi:hypothetical protein
LGADTKSISPESASALVVGTASISPESVSALVAGTMLVVVSARRVGTLPLAVVSAPPLIFSME